MPSVREQFKTYHDFASSTLEEIYGGRLKSADKYQVTTLESAVFINDGDRESPRFSYRPLPRLAQVAPVFGIVATDANADGHMDLVLAQNFYSPQRETGRMAGGLGLLLKGDGSGGFKAVWPGESGIVIPGDAKGLVLGNFGGAAGSDLLVGINDGAMELWKHHGDAGKYLVIELGGAHHLRAGARVTVVYRDGRRQGFEMHAGSGYLSQQPARVSVLRRGLESVQVVWSDGRESVLSDPASFTGKARLMVNP